MTEINIQSFLPLTEATFFILVSLAPAPRHGYAILKDVEAISHGRIIFSTGTLYGALTRLLDQGWIERVEAVETASNGRLKKAYRLTSLGRSILQAEYIRLQSLVTTADKRLASMLK